MMRALQIGFFLMATFGLMGQYTAMAANPLPIAEGATTMVNADPGCAEMAGARSSQDLPCAKMTLDCMVAMGCVPLTLNGPAAVEARLFALPDAMRVASPVAHLHGRSYGPEPDPPSFLI